MEDFEQNKVHLLKILLNNLIFFLFPKFLELFFTPKKNPPKVKNSKMSLNHLVFGTPFSKFICEENSMLFHAEKFYGWWVVVETLQL